MHDFKITFLTERKSEDQAYAERMAKTVYRYQIDRPLSKAQLKYESRHKNPEAYERYLNRPLPAKWKAVPNAKTRDQAVGVRSFDVKEISHVESLRRQSKNIQGDFMGEALSSAETRREAAENAFLVSPGLKHSELTDEQRELIASLVGYSELPLEVEEPKRTLLQRFKESFKLKKRDEIDKNNLAYVLYKISGGKDEDL